MTKDWFTVAELSKVAEVSKPTIYSWMNRQWIVNYKVGGRRRIDHAEWLAFLSRGKK